MKNYSTHTLGNGFRIIHQKQLSPVSYCGVIVNVGSRDEKFGEYGMAHFIEHMLFKGTKKRKSAQIINRLEDVGGELNAYTSKEETVVYAGFLNEYSERTIELISDLIQHSIFPQAEIEKEILVIRDEIQSYNDSPAELIYDEFEEILFGSNLMAHNVLGEEVDLLGFNSDRAKVFYHNFYQPENMVFFFQGNTEQKKIVKWVEKYFDFQQEGGTRFSRTIPQIEIPTIKTLVKDTCQFHCLMGARAYDIHHKDRIVLYLLNNILGGPGMNSLLNLALRERNGLVYTVESTIQSFSDCGWWGVYFGTDPENATKCEKLVKKELLKLCETRISDVKLRKYKLQLLGQLAIAGENKESLALSMGKSYLRFGKFDSNEQVRKEIETITSEQLQQVAAEVFHVDNLTILKYVR